MLNLVPLFTFGEVLRRIGAILRIDGEEAARAGLRVLGIWLLAWLAYRVVVLAARRIEIAVDAAKPLRKLIDFYLRRRYRPVETAQWPGQYYRSVILSKRIGALASNMPYVGAPEKEEAAR